MNRYRVLLPVLINGEHKQGDEFDHDFTPEEEADNLRSGLLEIVPREYRVLAEDTEVYGARTGGTFLAGLQIENEAALVGAGTIERVEEPPKKPRKKKGDE